MNYFINTKTEAEIKARYKQLAMQHHPDRGGDAETMQEINLQYMALEKNGWKHPQNINLDSIYEQYRQKRQQSPSGANINVFGIDIPREELDKIVLAGLSIIGDLITNSAKKTKK